MTGKKKATSPSKKGASARAAKSSAKKQAKIDARKSDSAKSAIGTSAIAKSAIAKSAIAKSLVGKSVVGKHAQPLASTVGQDAVMAKAVHDVMHPVASPERGAPPMSPSPSRMPLHTASAPAAPSGLGPRTVGPSAAASSPPAIGESGKRKAAKEPSVAAPAPVLAAPKPKARTAPASAAEAPPPGPSVASAPVATASPPSQATIPDMTAAPRKPAAAAAPETPPLPVPDFEALSTNMSRLMEESGKLAATYYGADRPPPKLGADVADAVQTLGQVAEQWFGDPARFIQAQSALTASFFDLWAASAQRMAGGAPEEVVPLQRPADKRFSHPEWRENPVYDFVHKAFLLGSTWANDLVDKADLDEPTREKARFYMRQITSALSPSNFVPTNPELLRETLKENGGNLLRGMKMLAEDIAAGKGQLRIRHTDSSKFALGVNMAMTPGKVVFRNDLMELLQYAPSTPQVLARPLLIVPPWINKFYVLDLNPEKSFIRWAVEQGLTVFLISWVNPDERHATKDFEAYMREGILAALDEIGAITGQPDATAIGYCVGGTLLSVTLAYMAAHGDTRLSSATLFTAQVDFSYAGDLKVFADESQIRALETQMRDQGYLQGAHMAQAFNMLRPEELIWTYVVNNYLKGREPQPFDLLAWNSDSTRMPAANHSFYLRNCYLENNLARGLMEVAGERLDLKRVTIPIYNLATREDHIAPAVSVFEGCRYFGGPVNYVLSGSGHVAGVVNPPSKVKYGYADGPEPKGTLDAWLKQATLHPGSWWPNWIDWIRGQAPAMVAAREPGGGKPVLGDAPGTYVRMKA